MAFDLNLPIRAVQFLFAIISLGLNGYGMTQNKKPHSHFAPPPPFHLPCLCLDFFDLLILINNSRKQIRRTFLWRRRSLWSQLHRVCVGMDNGSHHIPASCPAQISETGTCYRGLGVGCAHHGVLVRRLYCLGRLEIGWNRKMFREDLWYHRCWNCLWRFWMVSFFCLSHAPYSFVMEKPVFFCLPV